MTDAVFSADSIADLPSSTNSAQVRRVLYHHRTQGKAVEGVHIRGITDGLRALGVAVDILSLPGADPYQTPASMSPTRQATRWMRYLTRLPEWLFELAEIAYNAVVWWRMRRYLRRHPDVDLIYERYSLFMIATVAIARKFRIPLVLEVNDATFVDRVRPLRLTRLARRMESYLFRRVDGLVFVSRTFRDRAVQVHGPIAPAIIAPNAANLQQFTVPTAQRLQTRLRHGLGDSTVCGYLGAFVPWHSIHEFVYRITPRLDERPDLKLLLVGDGATFEDVRSWVQSRNLQSRIVLTGRVAHRDVPALLAAMDLAILPSAGDYTSPVKLFEFMAAGVAPVAPDFGPIREVLSPGKTGWIFRAGDLDAAVDSVLQHSRDLPALRRVGQAARNYIASERQWSNNVDQLLAFRRQLMRPEHEA
jgi:glycosyltransferase involved in cell wall biosynthesis